VTKPTRTAADRDHEDIDTGRSALDQARVDPAPEHEPRAEHHPHRPS
jgi:hypothetical protein